MSFRVTNSSTSANFMSYINTQRSRLNVLQERISTNKRINRPSDDPAGAEAVLNLRTSQAEIEQFKRNAGTAGQKLTASDNALDGYQNILERVRTLVSQGLSDVNNQTAKESLATEIDTLRNRILNIANGKNGDEYLFGGTRQDAPPFDPSTSAPAASTTTPQYIQIEPGANAIQVGATADTIFSDSNGTIFADLTAASAALRGTGDETADKAALNNTIGRLKVYTDTASVSRAVIGANMNITELANDRLGNDSIAIDEQASTIEDADFAETALELKDTQTTLEATLQTAAANRRSLFDFL